MPEVLEAHDAVLGEGVDLADGDDVGEDVAEPLRVQEVEVAQRGVVVVQQEAVLVQELGRLAQLGLVTELEAEPRLHLAVDGLRELVPVEHRVVALPAQLGREDADEVLQREVGRGDLLLQQLRLA